MPAFHVTIRHGGSRIRYHTFEVEAPDLQGALARAAEQVPSEIGTSGDLVEIRRAADPDARPGA